MALIVQKYGGNILSTPEKIKSVAHKIKQLTDQGDQVVAVVSAMGKTTDELTRLAYQVSSQPIRREFDMLLSVGERISMSLLSMALNDLGLPTKSFTGSQAGIITEPSHTQARIMDVRPMRIEKELFYKNTIIIAGFQGVSAEEKEITTLGRGGTDTTAVAMAHALKAHRCEIIKEVGGIYSADPQIVPQAKRHAQVSFGAALEATYWGAKILHYRAVELAKKLKIPLHIKHIQDSKISTIIHGECPVSDSQFEAQKIFAISSIKNIAICELNLSLTDSLKKLGALLKEKSLPWPQILSSETENDSTRLFLASSEESLSVLMNALQETLWVKKCMDQYSTVTATCFGQAQSSMSLQILEKLSEEKIAPEKIFLTPQSVSILVKQNECEKAIKALHQLI